MPGCYYIFENEPDTEHNKADDEIINGFACMYCTEEEIKWLDSIKKYWRTYNSRCKTYYGEHGTFEDSAKSKGKKSFLERIKEQIKKLGV
jgi:hypothetical protein